MKKYHVKPGSKVDLDEWDPGDSSEFDGDKQEGRAALKKLNEKLAELQELTRGSFRSEHD